MIVKCGAEEDCVWFGSDAGHSAITTCTNIAKVWAQAVATFGGAGTSDDVVSIGGTVRVN